jgi:hypothetical protein
MKKTLIMLFLLGLSLGTVRPARAQVQIAIQLGLNIQKLNQLRKILQNMYDGYKILTEGYNKIRNVVQGNYKIHEAFLDGLMAVSPAVKNYKRVADIISAQKKILDEYKKAFRRFRESGAFSPGELQYLGKVYDGLIKRSIQHVEELLMVVTASKLRMSDAERLQAIDRLFTGIQDQLSFLRAFNGQASVLAIQRAAGKSDVNMSKKLHGIE